MDQITSLLQVVLIAVISVFTTQIDSIPLPVIEPNIATNLVSPEGKSSNEPTSGPKFVEFEKMSTESVALTLPISAPTAAFTTDITPTLSIPTPTEIKPSKTPTPTTIPSPTSKPTNTPLPTKKPTPTPTPKPTLTPTPTFAPYVFKDPQQSVAPLSSSLDPEYIFEKINEHRIDKGLKVFEKEDELCKLAKDRAPEVYDEIFTTHSYHSGLHNRHIPYWINENIAYFQTEDMMISWWLNDYIHRIAIEGKYKYSCVACHGKSCTQLFTNYQPR